MVTQVNGKLVGEYVEEAENLIDNGIWDAEDPEELDHEVDPREEFCVPLEGDLGEEIGPELQVVAMAYRTSDPKVVLVRFALREVTPHSPDSANPEFVSITRNERVLGLPPGRAHAPYAELILGTKQMREYMDPEQFMIQVLDESIEMVSSQLNRTTSVRAGLKVKKASFMRLPGVYRTQVAQLLEAIFGSRE